MAKILHIFYCYCGKYYVWYHGFTRFSLPCYSVLDWPGQG